MQEKSLTWIVVITDGDMKTHIGPFSSADDADAWMLRRGAILSEGCPPATKHALFDPRLVIV